MEITVKALRRTDASTISTLEIDGIPECYVLEDPVRETDEPVEAWKIKGKTAIPAGKYRVVITPSARFHRDLPLLEGVPGFSGIRIHPGNFPGDTEGCLLPGMSTDHDAVLYSKAAFEALYDKIEAAIARGEEVWISLIRQCST